MKKGPQQLLRAFIVDRRSELSNHIHKDLVAVDKYLQVGEWQ
ncbi:hypothetical protein ACFS7Z_21845 [Pontibacter toksunensis]|uniref:Uncharacterized protein n=1 Tax=Pontibacter toksunensis TaxID=1332631 RepID=A0ABW6BZA0_9BACT